MSNPNSAELQAEGSGSPEADPGRTGDRNLKESYVRELSPTPSNPETQATAFRVPLPGSIGDLEVAPRERSKANAADPAISSVKLRECAREIFDVDVADEPDAENAGDVPKQGDTPTNQEAVTDVENLDEFLDAADIEDLGVGTPDAAQQLAEPELPDEERAAILPEEPEPSSQSPAALAASLLVGDARATQEQAPPTNTIEEDEFDDLLKIADESPTLQSVGAATAETANELPLIDPIAVPSASARSPRPRYGAATLVVVFAAVCLAVVLVGQLWLTMDAPASTMSSGETTTEVEPGGAQAMGSPDTAAPPESDPTTIPTPSREVYSFEDLPTDSTKSETAPPTDEAPTAMESTKSEKPATEQAPATQAKGATGTLAINSIPASSVFLDGKQVGRTPQFALSVSAGRHSVRLVHPERGEHVVHIDVAAGKRRVVSHKF
jgi:hypothetical protein